MAEVDKREKTHQILSSSSSSLSNYPRDLLQRFTTMNQNNHNYYLSFPVMKVDNEEEDEEIELSLDLSMNGRFGVDPIAKKIKRTTSIPEFTNPMKIREHVSQMNNNWSTNLIRTCSLPSETEEEWKRRKEMQTLRRMEAKRKRSEKQRNLKAMKERNRGCGGGGSSEEMIGLEEGGGGRSGADEFNNLRRTTSLTTKVSRLGLNGLPPPSPSPPPVSIGSSQGTPGSSVISETESEQGLGTKPADARNPIDGYSSPESEQKSPAKMLQNHLSSSENRTEDTGRNLLEDMPCVSTKGDGPNGKKIDGFLRYGKGEEVRIVCVCHRSVLTPAEFIKHAGGGEVANPLKHIIVSPSML